MKTMGLVILMVIILSTKGSWGQQVAGGSHAWEMHINLWAPQVSDRVSIVYPYMLKRNIKKRQKSGALRMMVFPFSGMLSAYDKEGGDTIFNWTKSSFIEFEPMIQVGYEWQKLLGNGMLYYGADLGWRMYSNLGISHDYSWSDGVITINQRKLKNQTNDAWLAGFAGMKYYLGSRFSISLETQIQVNRTVEVETFSYAGKRMYKDKETAIQILPFSQYLFNLSYNF